jgi:hypothetical protein
MMGAKMNFGKRVSLLAALMAILSTMAHASSAVVSNARGTGVSALWLLANFSYAGMRAQNHPSVGWRILAFIFGLPGTVLTFFVVDEGSERAYGVEIPKKRG